MKLFLIGIYLVSRLVTAGSDYSPCKELLKMRSGDFHTLLKSAIGDPIAKSNEILADYLRDHDFTDWPRLIVIMNRLNEISTLDPERQTLIAEAEKIIAKPGNLWAKSFPALGSYYQHPHPFTHPVIHLKDAQFRKFLALQRKAFYFEQGLPVLYLSSHQLPKFYRLSDDQLFSLTGLRINLQRSGHEDIQQLMNHLRAPITSLAVENILDTNGVRTLAQHPYSEHLNRLKLKVHSNGEWKRPYVLPMLLDPKSQLSHLTELDLSGSDVSFLQLQQLFESNQMSKLVSLRLSESLECANRGASDRSLVPIDTSKILLTQLIHLDLSENPYIFDNRYGPHIAPDRSLISSLIRGPFKHIRAIDLSQNRLDAHFLSELVNSQGPSFENTSYWNLSQNNFNARGFANCLGPHSKLKNAHSLNLSRSDFLPSELSALSAANHALRENLIDLNLEYLKIGLPGIKHMARARFAALEYLNLGNNHIDAEGLEILLSDKSRFHQWPLKGLVLRENALHTEAAMDVLDRATPYLKKLKFIDMTEIYGQMKPITHFRFHKWVEQLRPTTQVIF